MSDRFLRLISDDLVTYDFNEYFRIVSMPITYNRSFEHVPDNAGGVDIADGTPKERIISIEGILKADDYTALHAQERLLKKALNKGGKLYIYPDKLDMFLEVKIQDVDESIPEEDPLAIVYSIVFVAEIPFWQSEEEFESENVLTPDVFTKLSNSADLPAGTGYGATFSPDGIYLVISHATTPYLTIYKRTGDEFVKLDDPSDLPASHGRGAAFSPDGVYLVIAHYTTPFLTIYKRTGDEFVKLDDPADLPAGTGYGAAFSPDGVYLVISHATTPYLTIYKRTGDEFVKLDNPADLPAGTGYGAAFSPDGVYLVIAHVITPYLTIYKRTGDEFVKLDDPADLPASHGQGVAFSPDGVYLVIAHYTTPFLTIYKRTGDEFVKLDDPADLPAGTGQGAAFSPDGVYLVIAHATTPYLTIYKRTGDEFVKLDNPADLPAGTGYGAAFSPDGVYLVIAHVITPYLTIYKRDSSILIDYSDSDFIFFPEITIEANQGEDLPSVILKNYTDFEKYFTFESNYFTALSAFIINGNLGLVTLDGTESFENMVTPWQYLRLRNEINEFIYSGGPCTITIKYRKLYL